MNIKLERPAQFLILSNAVTIAIALYQGWTASEVMWIYWTQSLVIGFFNVLRLLRLGELEPGEETSDGRLVPPTTAARRAVAVFFAFHYGLFHVGYFFFLSHGGSLPGGSDFLSFAFCVATFIVNHAYSYRENVADDLRRRPDIASVMMFPYQRIMPMHLTLIIGGFFAKDSLWVLLLFLSLKTVADVKMHLVEHGK